MIRSLFKLYFIILLLIVINFFIRAQVNKQTEHKFEKQITLTVPANYLLYLPKDYNKSEENFPLVLFLHGSGERGNDLAKVKTHGIPKLIAEGKNFPFICVSPQCPENIYWNIDILSALLDEIESKYRVDTNRIYVTGLSMGGHGTWELAMKEPNRFAAIAPVCGWADTTEVCVISHLPIWVFHGAKDMTIPVGASESLVRELKKCGSDVKLTIYPQANHDAWTETYNNNQLYEWLLSHSKNKDN